MKNFQVYTTFNTSSSNGIESDVEQTLLVEGANMKRVNVAEGTLKAHMDDLANGSKKITNSIYHIADTTIIQEATQQNIDRYGNDKIDYEIFGISASVQAQDGCVPTFTKVATAISMSIAIPHRRRLDRYVRRKFPGLSRATQFRWRSLINCRRWSVPVGRTALHARKQRQ